MRLQSTCLAFLVAVCLLAGCGGGGDGQILGAQGLPDTGSIAVNHTLARTVSTFVATFRFSGRNAGGAVIYGPVEFPKATEILLEEVSPEVVTLRIEYLSATGAVIGTFETAVTVSRGNTFAVENPAWVDEAPAVPSFGPATNVAVGREPQDVVAGDFDGDGNLDFASTDSFDGTVTVRLGDGAGAFATGVPYAVPGASGISAGDLDGDNVLDLIVGSISPASLSVLAGNGDGTFAPAVSYAAIGGIHPAVADMDGDGAPDVVIANFVQTTNSQVQVLLNDGAGQLAVQPSVSVAPLNRIFVTAAGDFDGDGDADVAVVSQNPTGRYAVLLNDGAGGLGPASVVALSINLYGVVAGDLDGDGRVDLACTSSSDDTFFLRGNGDGTFATGVSVGPNGSSLATGDVNSDGRPDLVSSRPAADQVHVMLGNGDGTFTDGGGFAAGDNPTGVALGDFNEDGRIDLLDVNFGDDNASLILQTD